MLKISSSGKSTDSLNSDFSSLELNSNDSESEQSCLQQVPRLSRKVIPESYELKITPYLNEDVFWFEGDVEIKIKVLNKTKTITLHNEGLDIIVPPKIISADESKNVLQFSKNFSVNPSTGIMTINFFKELNEGYYTLLIEYRCTPPDTFPSNKSVQGFLSGKYTNSRGGISYLATTIFYPIGARRAFPCFDEPSFKANFSISIRHQSTYHAISNTLIIKDELDHFSDNMIWTTFAETPKMSTYSVAFAITDFASVENETLNFRIWMQRTKIEYAKYALDTGRIIMEEYERYTGISQRNCGIKKFDLMALPNKSYRTIGNWGLITHWMPDALLVDENVTAMFDIQNLVSEITQDLALQWFRHLVSPSWWQHMWLSEGFANFFYFHMVHKVRPAWRMIDQMVVASIQASAFPMDSDSCAVAMDNDISSSDEIIEKMGELSYYKGGAIIRMIFHILGKRGFRDAIRVYLQLKQFDSAISADLFGALIEKLTGNSSITKKDFYLALQNWQSTPGYPIITVTRDFMGTTAKIRQERFLSNDDVEGLHAKKYWIPLNFAQSKKCFDTTEVTHWMKPTDDSITISIPNTDGWVIFNKQQFGYYRVSYDHENWQRIIKVLKSPDFQNIHVLNRAQLIDDALNLARVSKLDYSIAFDLVSYLEREIDFIPWLSATHGFSFLYERLANTKYHRKLQAYILDLLDPLLTRLGNEPKSDDQYLTNSLRSLALIWGCKVGSRSSAGYALHKLKQWLEDSDKNPLSNDAKFEILCGGIYNSDRTTWNRLFAKFTETMDTDLLLILGCSPDESVLKNYLTLIDIGLDFNKLLIVNAVYRGSGKGTNIALDFLIEKGRNIEGNVFDETGTISIFQKFWCFSEPGPQLTTHFQIQKLKDFKANLKRWPNHVVKKIGDIIEEAENNVRWVEENADRIGDFFINFSNRT